MTCLQEIYDRLRLQEIDKEELKKEKQENIELIKNLKIQLLNKDKELEDKKSI